MHRVQWLGLRAGVVVLMSALACSNGGSKPTGGNNPVTAVSPADGASAVATNSAISATFTSAPSTVQFTLTPAAAGTVSIDATTATFHPAQPLAGQTAYAVLVTADGAIAKAWRFTTAPVADTTAPAAVTNLSVLQKSATSVQLQWTASGDDGAAGTATSYDLRYGACPLSDTSFGAATHVATGAPQASGATEVAVITGLSAKTQYCVALKVLDEVPNASALSNVVQVTTADDTTPASPVLSATAVTGTSVQIGWTAVGDDLNTGTVATQDLRYAPGSSCSAASFASGTAVTLGAPHAAGTAETATASNLTSDTVYCFMLKVADAAGNAAYSNALVVRTHDVTAPSAVTDLAISGLTDTSLTLSWTATGDDAMAGTAWGYDLRTASGAACPITDASFSAATQLSTSAPKAPHSAETRSVTGLTTKVTYCYAIKVLDEAGNVSPLSNEAMATTLDVIPPAAPVLTAGAITGSSVQVNWTAVGDDGNTGTVATQELRFAPAPSGCPLSPAQFATGTVVTLGAPHVAGTHESVNVTGLTSDLPYCFMLKVADAAGNTVYSNALAARTPDVTAPAAAVLTVANLTASSLTLQWTAPGDDGATGTATSYDLRSATGAACPITTTSFASATQITLPAPQAAGAAESYAVSGLSQKTTYCYALETSDEAGNVSAMSNVATATTPDVTPPSNPQLQGTPGGTSVLVTWTAVGDDANVGTAATQQLRYAPAPTTCPLTSANFATTGTAVTGLGAPQAAGASESFNVTGLTSDSPYCFMLKVADAAGNAAYSNAFSTRTTDITAPAAVTLSLTPPTGTSITITWTAPGDDGTTGTAAAYHLRGATGAACPITTTSFAGLTDLTIPAPKAAGQAESYTASGLTEKQTYCYALTTSDEVPNTSAMSNVVSATIPDLTPPAQPQLSAGTITASSIDVKWAAVGDDGNTGTVATQELWFGTTQCPLTSANYATGSKLLPPAHVAGTQETYTVGTLASDTGYCFVLRVADAAGNQAFSNTLSARTPDVTPPAQATLSLGAVTQTTVGLSWNETGDDGMTGTATSQQLYQSTACPITTSALGTPIATPAVAAPNTAQSTTVSSLAADTAYCFALLVTDDAGNSTLSTQVNAHTLDAIPPAKPVLYAGPIGSDGLSVEVRWTAVGDDGNTGTVQSNELRYRSASACSGWTNFADGAQVMLGAPNVAGSTESGDVTTVPDTDYCFWLRVADDSGHVVDSDIFTMHSKDVQAPEQVTVTVKAGTLDTTSVSLQWLAPHENGTQGGAATYYELRSQSGVACSSFDSTTFEGGVLQWTAQPKAPGTQEQADLTGLGTDADYCFIVAAFDEAGNASYSTSLPVHTLDVVAPSAPVIDSTSVVGATVTLSFRAPGDNADQGTASAYRVAYVVASGACPAAETDMVSPVILSSGLPQPQVAGTAQTIALADLAEHTTYCFALQALDEVPNASAYSAVVTATTGSADFSAPAQINDLTAAITADTKVRITWTAPADNVGTASYVIQVAKDTDCPAMTNAQAVSQTITPQAAGQAESFTFDFATASSEAVCVTVQGADLAGNVAPASNVAFPPSRIADLVATGTDDSTIGLAFSAPGNHFQSGTAHSYGFVFGLNPGTCPTDLPGMFALNGVTTSSATDTVPYSTPYTTSFGSFQPGTAYCAAVVAHSDTGDEAISNIAAITTPDTTPPATVIDLAVAAKTSRSVSLKFSASGDNGTQGAAASYVLAWTTGADCSGPGDSIAITPAVPPLAGTEIDHTVIGLVPSTAYCFAVDAIDAHLNHSGFSPALAATTDTDGVAPGQITIAPIAAGDSYSAGARLQWVAPADDGSDPASGMVAAYDVRYVKVTTDCSALTAASFASATPVLTQPTPSATPGTLEKPDVLLQSADKDQAVCFAVVAVDAALNTSAVSNWVFSRDNTPPADVSDLSAQNATLSSAELHFTAVGDDGVMGTAASYSLWYRGGVCSGSFDPNGAIAVSGLPAPQAAGLPEVITVTGLDYNTKYCFGLRVSDEIPNRSNIVTVDVQTLSGNPVAELATIRSTIAGATATPMALTNAVHGGIVTYVKAAVNGAATGTLDGAGYFIQNGATGPAIYVALDPSGISVGDVVDLTATQGAWLCTAACDATNSIFAVTGGTAVVRSHGATPPAAQDVSALSATTWPLPIAAVADPFAYEAELVKAALTVTSAGFAAQGDGFVKAQVTTTGVTAGTPNLQLRVPAALATSMGLVAGSKVNLLGTPMWRTGAEADFAIWASGDAQVSPTVLSTTPVDGATSVATNTAITVKFNVPIDPTSIAFTSTTTCSGTIQIFTGFGTTACLPISTITLDGTATIATITPGVALSNSARYRLSVTTGLKSTAALTALAYTAANGFITVQSASAACTTPKVVISQVYGGGGNSGATYKNDFIELHNRSSAPADISGWSVQYASASTTGAWTSTNKNTFPAGTIIPAGGYFTIREAAGSGGTVDVPYDLDPTQLSPAQTALALSATAGKVALVSSSTSVSGACPAIGSAVGTGVLVDFVAFGQQTGTGACTVNTLTLTNTTADFRGGSGCSDTSNNYVDFNVGAPSPRTASTPVATCSCSGGATQVAVNGLGHAAGEINYCNLWFPTAPITLSTSDAMPTTYVHVWDSNYTMPGGTNGASTFKAEVGYGGAGSNPFTQFVFTPGAYNPSCSSCTGSEANNDEWMGTFTKPASGSYQWVWRVSIDSGAHWTYCPIGGTGSNSGQPAFSTSNLASLTVQ